MGYIELDHLSCDKWGNQYKKREDNMLYTYTEDRGIYTIDLSKVSVCVLYTPSIDGGRAHGVIYNDSKGEFLVSEENYKGILKKWKEYKENNVAI